MFIVAYRINPGVPCSSNSESEEVNSNRSDCKSEGVFKFSVCFAFYLVAISAAPLYAGQLTNKFDYKLDLNRSNFRASGEWMGPITYLSNWVPSYKSYDEIYTAQYNKQSNKVTLNVLLYLKESQGNELISSGNRLVDKDIWDVDDDSKNQVVLGKGNTTNLEVNKATISSRVDGQCARVWYWFEIGGNYYTKKWQAKLYGALAKLQGNFGAAFISVSTTCLESNKLSDAVLNEYVLDNYQATRKSIKW